MRFAHSAQRITPPARRLLTGMFCSRLSQYALWPFLAITMHRQFGMGLSEIGALFAANIILSSLLAPFSGYLGDRYQRVNLMLAALLLSILGFIGMAVLASAAAYTLGILLGGIAQSMLEPGIRVLLRQTVADGGHAEQDRALLFHLRYYLVNFAAAIGPLLGAALLRWDIRLVLGAAIMAQMLYMFCLLSSAPKNAAGSPAQAGLPPFGFMSLVREIAAHRAFRMLFVANFLLAYIYAQNEEPLTFYLLSLKIPDIEHIVSLFSLTNVVVVLGFHLLFMNKLAQLKEHVACLLAFPALAAAQFVLAFNPVTWPAGWLIGLALASLAEVIAMPLFSVAIDKMAPEAMRGSFFGVSMLIGVGAGSAPWLGGWAIEHLGGQLFFSMLGWACIPLALLSWLSLRKTSV